MSTSRQAIAKVIVSRIGITPPAKLANQLAAYLVTERRTHELEPIMRDVDLLRGQVGSIEAEVTTAHVLHEFNLAAIKELIKKHKPEVKQINLLSKVDPKLVGGLKIDLTGEQLDMSVRGQVNQLKRVISEGLN